IEAGGAHVETYNLVMHPVGPQTSLVLKTGDDGSHLRIMGGRALDRFERRDGEGRIAGRGLLLDLSGGGPPGGPGWASIKEGLRPGAREADPSYAHFQRA